MLQLLTVSLLVVYFPFRLKEANKFVKIWYLILMDSQPFFFYRCVRSFLIATR